MLSNELRQKFLQFFKDRGHAILPSASLIPENDPSVLFTTAGMHPLVPYLLGEKHPAGNRLADCQKCVRTGDIDDVGDRWHQTFFEMLGNWSLGNYFKEKSIPWSYEFLTKELGIDSEKIAVTVFAGDADAPADEESYKLWLEVGIPAERIYKYNKEENWWPAGGKHPGPQGPCTEIFYINDFPACGPNCEPKCSCGKYTEIWNNVFMEYKLKPEGGYEALAQKNVDTGMGLERTLAILSRSVSNYETDLFREIIAKIKELSGVKYGGSEETDKSIRIITDHLRTATFILGDDKGIPPSNVDQGYILRRLIRRAIRHGKKLDISEDKSLCSEVAGVIINNYKDVYPELEQNRGFILNELNKEELKFEQALSKGLKELNKLTRIGEIQKINLGEEPKTWNRVDAEKAFYIFQTYGFPLEMIQEELACRCLVVDEKEFNNEFKKHQDLSRTAAAGKFKGGLADDSYETTKLHTAAHLLLRALRQVLGEHVFQKGSNITAERLRFDFSHPEKMTEEQKKQVEEIVNGEIAKNLPVSCQEMSLAAAKEAGAMGVFEHKYGDRVKIYSIGDFSKEICGGPHVGNTSELGVFKIQKEEASSAGVRRIKAILQ